jgi:hypothetical protein
VRARNIKPGYFKNEILGKADPINGHVYQGLWCLADREGRLEDRPDRIHVEINPYRPGASTVQALDWLGANGFLVRYEVDGQKYIELPQFKPHQHPHVKESASKIPPPPKKHGTSTRQAPDKPGANPSDCGFLIPESLNLKSEGDQKVVSPSRSLKAEWEEKKRAMAEALKVKAS